MAQRSPIVGSVSNSTYDHRLEIVEKFQSLLKEGERKIKLSEEHKDAVLMLGNSGVGKSTLTLALVGAELESVKKSNVYLIKDRNEKICTKSTLDSCTGFPDLLVDNNTGTAFYDLPGFKDSRGTSHEMAITYSIKKVVDHLKSVKLVFVANHSSLIPSNNRHEFMMLVKHVTSLVKDIEKFKNSILLIANKVINEVDGDNCDEGGMCALLPDDKIISDIASFLQEAKQSSEQNLTSQNVSSEESEFYKQAIKFINILLEKEHDNYTRIGIFRRPTKSGLISLIPLLQKEKQYIDNMLYSRLNFTEKNNEDFGYTVSDGSKVDIQYLVEAINDNIWSDLRSIVGHMQGHYRHSIEGMRSKISSFATSTKAVDADRSEAQKFLDGFHTGYNITTNLREEVKNVTADKLAEKIRNSIVALGIDGCQKDLEDISRQGEYFEFLQVVSDQALATRPWDTLLQPVETYLSSSRNNTQKDIKYAAEKINHQIKANITSVAEEIKEHYQRKMSSMVIQQLPAKLNLDKAYGSIRNMTQEIGHLSTAQALSRKIRDTISHLDIETFKIRSNTYSVFSLGKYLAFLQIISDERLNTWSSEWIVPFNQTVKYLNDSNRWYVFLDNLYKKLSEYEVQKFKSKYNVANIEDFGQEDKTQGISVTRDNFKQFLKKVEPFSVKGYDDEIKDIEATELRIEDLNQVSRLTLDSKINPTCESDKLVIKGDYIKFSDFVGTDGILTTCQGAKSVNIFALHTLFIDENLKAIGNKLSVTAIAPRWEVIDSRTINLSGADGQPHHRSKADNGTYPGNNGDHGKPGLPGGSAGSFFGIGAAFFNGKMLTIMANGGNGGPGQDGGDGMNGRNGDSPTSYLDYYINNQRWCDAKCPQILGFECKVMFNHRCSDYTCDKSIDILGKQGTNGGNGGDGGWGSNGGKSGNITLMQLGNCLVSLRYPYLFYKTICYYKVVPMWKTKVFHIGTTQKADTI